MMCVAGRDNQGSPLDTNPLFSYEKPSFEEMYTLGEQIGEGRFGSVYKAHRNASKPTETFAVKVINRRFRSDEETAASNDEEIAAHEASILYRLRDVPNVVRLVDFFVDDNKMYNVQELAEGGDVFDRLVRNETYTEPCARDLVGTLLATVDSMHRRGVVHRDLKPENLLLPSEHDDAGILLCDFDSAKHLESRDERMVTVCGTLAYCAPEILRGDDGYGMEVDLWSVGCILYSLLGGYLPFGDGEDDDDDDDFHERVVHADFDFDDEAWDAVSDEAKILICHLLEADPKKRCTAKQALECDWFLGARDPDSSDSARNPLSDLDECRARRRLRAAVHAVRFSNGLKNPDNAPKLLSTSSSSSSSEATETETEADFVEGTGDLLLPLAAHDDAESAARCGDCFGLRAPDFGFRDAVEREGETTEAGNTETESLVDEPSTNEREEWNANAAAAAAALDDPLEQLDDEHQNEAREMELQSLATHRSEKDEPCRVNDCWEEGKNDIVYEPSFVKSELEIGIQRDDGSFIVYLL